MKQKYQKIIIPTLSIFLASCGGGGGNDNTSAPVNHHNSAKDNHSSVPQTNPSGNTESETIPDSDSKTAPDANPDTKPDLDLSVQKPQNDQNGTDSHSDNPSHSIVPDSPNAHATPNMPKLPENTSPAPNSKNELLNHVTHDITSSSETVSLINDTQYVDDEKLVKDIAIVDTSYYLSDSFKDKNGKLRLQTHDQNPALTLSPYSHGTMVAAVVNRYNKTAIIHAYNTYHDSNENVQVRDYDYDTAHNKGIRIFNNSYGNDAISYEYARPPRGNIAKYAKEDSIFVWAAGNENQDHGTPQSVYPIIDDDARNGWISVAEADY